MKLLAPLLTVLVLMTSLQSAQAQDPPREVGGFRLGSSIDEYDFITYRNYLKEVMVENIGGFRKGTIYYGVCEHPGEIVKITLKYADASKDFYEEALKRYKKKFGAPDQYTGDTFGILKAWKWQFTDKSGNKVSMTLQYNSMDPNESLGTVVKLSLPEQLEAERLCFNKMCEIRDTPDQEKAAPPPLDWDQMLPR